MVLVCATALCISFEKSSKISFWPRIYVGDGEAFVKRCLWMHLYDRPRVLARSSRICPFWRKFGLNGQNHHLPSSIGSPPDFVRSASNSSGDRSTGSALTLPPAN